MRIAGLDSVTLIHALKEFLPGVDYPDREVLMAGRARILIPPRIDEKAWRELRVYVREGPFFALEQARRRHHLERQIAELESRPASEGRARTLHLLRVQLESL